MWDCGKSPPDVDSWGAANSCLQGFASRKRSSRALHVGGVVAIKSSPTVIEGDLLFHRQCCDGVVALALGSVCRDLLVKLLRHCQILVRAWVLCL